MLKNTTFCLLLCICVSMQAQTPSTSGASKTYAFKNGNWFTGKAFLPADWYSVGGKLTQKVPAKIDSTFDLTGKFVVPPMADAFSASAADAFSAANHLDFYLREGVFYIQAIGNTQETRQKLNGKYNQSDKPDVLFSNGSITCTLGTPFLQYEPAAQGIKNPQVIAQKIDQIKLQRKGLGDGYWFMDTKEAVAKEWPRILAQKPGLISIYLLDVANKGGKENGGLTEEVAKAIIKKAHKSDLRVLAHIENLEDFRLAQKLGVDIIANLPGINWDGKTDAAKMTLTDADIKQLAKKKTVVITQLASTQAGSASKEAVQAQQFKTIKRLLDANVQVAMGSNDSQRTLRTEINYWFGLGEWDYYQMIRVLCEMTPRAIFPDRKIGRFEQGYEASFLVLEDNPVPNLLKIRAINMRVKNGVVLK